MIFLIEQKKWRNSTMSTSTILLSFKVNASILKVYFKYTSKIEINT